MTIAQFQDLERLAQEINVKLVAGYVAGVLVARFRDIETASYTRAALALKHIQIAELPENHSHLIG